jgi:hypothetical protein
MSGRFDWDVANREHIALHHVTPDEAEQVIMNNASLIVKIQSRKGEMRSNVFGPDHERTVPRGRIHQAWFDDARGYRIPDESQPKESV